MVPKNCLFIIYTNYVDGCLDFRLGKNELWRRFCTLVGIVPPTLYVNKL